MLCDIPLALTHKHVGGERMEKNSHKCKSSIEWTENYRIPSPAHCLVGAMEID